MCWSGRPRSTPLHHDALARPKESALALRCESMSSEEIIVVQADFSRDDHQRAIVDMTAAYARDPMADGYPL